MKERVVKKEAAWYKGDTLFGTLDKLPKIERSQNKMVRIPILSKIFLKGELEIFGKVESGVLVPNMDCMLIPQQEKLTITSI